MSESMKDQRQRIHEEVDGHIADHMEVLFDMMEGLTQYRACQMATQRDIAVSLRVIIEQTAPPPGVFYPRLSPADEGQRWAELVEGRTEE